MTDFTYLDTAITTLQPWPFARGLVLGLAMSAILWILIGVAVFVAIT